MLKFKFSAWLALAAATALLTPQVSEAQRRGGWGWGGGGWGGGGWGGNNWGIGMGSPYYGGYGGYGSGWGYGYPYRGGYYGGYGYGGPTYSAYSYPYGYGNYYGSPYVYGSTPYGSTPYYDTTMSGTYGYGGQGYITPASYQQSFYPSGAQQQMPQDSNAAMIEVRMPADAELLVDGKRTQQTGPTRLFVTPPLTPGKTFTYELTVKRTGDAVGQTREVQVQPGQRAVVDLTQPAGNQNNNPQNRQIQESTPNNPTNPGPPK